jgi:hypothetical protein
LKKELDSPVYDVKAEKVENVHYIETCCYPVINYLLTKLWTSGARPKNETQKRKPSTTVEDSSSSEESSWSEDEDQSQLTPNQLRALTEQMQERTDTVTDNKTQKGQTPEDATQEEGINSSDDVQPATLAHP